MAAALYGKSVFEGAGDYLGLGCKHYKRKCQLLTPCCGKFYTCRFCHDEQETHPFMRKLVQKIRCMNCLTEQTVHQRCRKCDIVFGKYFCLECRLFDDDDTKRQYHCKDCTICRIGGRANFFHCPTCDLCLNINLRERHVCINRASKADCPICLDNLHHSRDELCVPRCGHLIHKKCYDSLLSAGKQDCPTCRKPMSLLEIGNCY